ncbi:hypothetical protein Ahy_A04g019265 isoform B [Arachis hypogaea]|uniref:Aminotransferase-like plant mobile domain-containing protein n=1 Tax=Arachis hypogaea TaxID=3818 RepID=A0A445DFP5_ARAHY|nr:hypothetical protein Ahy_A04g019265 isoform B [Arachis hypogaea]
MPLNDRIMPYVQIARLAHLMRLNDHWFKLDEPLLGLPIDGHYVSGCLTDFETYIEGGRPVWARFQELLGVMPPPDYIDKFIVKCTWMQQTFSHLPEGVGKETVRRYTRVYIMMLLSTQIFDNKSGTRMHIRWLSYMVRLEDMDSYS